MIKVKIKEHNNYLKNIKVSDNEGVMIGERANFSFIQSQKSWSNGVYGFRESIPTRNIGPRLTECPEDLDNSPRLNKFSVKLDHHNHKNNNNYNSTVSFTMFL